MKYYCLLRGINVSGKKLIKMEELGQVFIKMGFSRVITFIQSGNIILESDEVDENLLVSLIEKHLLENFGYSIPTFLRTQNEWLDILKNSPYKDSVGDSDFKFYVTLFSTVPQEELKSRITKIKPEAYLFYNRELYTKIAKGSTDDELFSNNYIERTLKMPATTRNWNTMTKLMDL